MISRFYLKDCLTFNEVELEFKKGLIVFTGASGAGKSVLMNSILSLFAVVNPLAKISEVTIENIQIAKEDYDIDFGDEIVIKQFTNTKTRFFLNNQTISKKNLKNFTSKFARYLHLKDTTDFDSNKLVGFLDFIVALHNKQHQENLQELKHQYQTLQELKTKLKQILTQEQQIEDLVSYTKFEIDKIAKIDPKPNEYDELKDIKDQISKKEKFEAKLEEITPILSQLYKISDLLNRFGISGDFFDDAVAQVEQQLTSLHTELKNIDIDLEKSLYKLNRQFLHAKTLGFVHPKSGKELEFSSILPQDLENILKMLRNINK